MEDAMPDSASREVHTARPDRVAGRSPSFGLFSHDTDILSAFRRRVDSPPGWTRACSVDGDGHLLAIAVCPVSKMNGGGSTFLEVFSGFVEENFDKGYQYALALDRSTDSAVVD